MRKISFYENGQVRTSVLKACILPKSLTKWGGIFKVHCMNYAFFHAYDKIDM